jgi:phospholipid/cholesterol/gamma-HCH transport system substrate-binding protein
MKRRDVLVGLVFISAVAGIGYLTVVIKGLSTLIGPHLAPLTITFPEVLALEEGEEARAKGVKVGQVSAVEYRNDATVAVRVTLFADPHLREGCSFRIRSKSPLGGKYLEIDPGPTTGAPVTRTAFEGERPSDLFSELGEVLGSRKKELVELIDNLRDTTRAIREGQGAVGALIFDTELKANVSQAVRELARAVTGEGPKGLLYTLLHDEKLAENVSGTIGDLRDIVRRSETPLGVLLHDAEAGRDVKSTLSDVAALARDIRAGKGTVGRLFADDELYSKAVELAEGLGAISEGEGVLSYLLKDPDSRVQGREALRNLRDLLVKLNEGDGTVARLINKPDVYDQAHKLLVQIRESVEDAREQAPINQLVNLLGAVY